MVDASVGIIGGTGLYNLEGLKDVKEVNIDTPFGSPSSSIVVGSFEGVSVAFLPRHGSGHTISPTNIPARANIFALKKLGVSKVIAVSAVGSLRENIAPLDLVIPNQIIDRTKTRASTFFDGSIVAHVGFANPFCGMISHNLYRSASALGANVHNGGTYVVIEGPQFSSLAESNLYRSWGADVIGMTALPEAKLAREAELCYAILACSTDYDCWRGSEESVTVDMVVANLNKNIKISKKILEDVIPNLSQNGDCECNYAMENAIISARDSIDAKDVDKLGLLVQKYMS